MPTSLYVLSGVLIAVFVYFGFLDHNPRRKVNWFMCALSVLFVLLLPYLFPELVHH